MGLNVEEILKPSFISSIQFSLLDTQLDIFMNPKELVKLLIVIWIKIIIRSIQTMFLFTETESELEFERSSCNWKTSAE